MEFYLDIHINPDVGSRDNRIMSRVFTNLHNALVELKSEQIGVSFPNVKIRPGRLLRIHGNKINLCNLQSLNWLCKLPPYFNISDVLSVPAAIKFRTVSRVRSNMSKSKLNRLKRRRSIPPEEESIYKAKMYSIGLDNPYLDLKSGSTGQVYRHFFSFGPLVNQPVHGKFDSYGLSKKATVPWF